MSIVKAEFVDLRDVRPFVKWAGGKGQLLSELNKLVPSQFNRYFEPFLGGTAMFLHLASKNMISTAYLSDTNEELIKAFKVVRDSVGELIEVLNQHQRGYDKNPCEYYYRLRDVRCSRTCFVFSGSMASVFSYRLRTVITTSTKMTL
jgi:DNA adenine methylase